MGSRCVRIAAMLVVSAGMVSVCLFAGEEEKTFDRLFGKEAEQVMRSGDRADDVAFAAKLLAAGDSAEEQPAFRALLCEKAYEFGVRIPSGYATAVKAMLCLVEMAPERKDDWDEKLLNVYQLQSKGARSADEKARAGDGLLPLLLARADARVGAWEFAEAVALYRRAIPVDAAVQGGGKQRIQILLRYAESRQRLLRRVDQLRTHLQGKPDDKDAAANLVQLCLVELDKPTEAARYADHLGDDTFKKYVLVAAMKPANLPEKAALELAKWYKDFADGAADLVKPRMLARAKRYYERYLALHAAEDAAGTAARMALEQVTEELDHLVPPACVRELVVEAFVDGSSEFWVTPKGVFWKSLRVAKPGRHGGANEPTWINGRKWMPKWGKPGEERGFDETKPYPLPVGKLDFKLKLLAVGTKKGCQGIERRDPVSLRTRRGALVVSIPDHRSGSRWYRFRLYRP